MNDRVVFTLNPSIRSPTFIASADLHLGLKLYNYPELSDDLSDNLIRLVDLAIYKKVQYLVIAGDLFNDNQCKPPIIAFVTRQVNRLKEAGIKLVGIEGDHDKPLKGESWLRISGIQPVTIEPTFAGLSYFDYSLTTIENIVDMLKDGVYPDKVQWIFLHCQVPQLFKMAEAKKIIDYNRMNLFTNFPNIQGLILGDLHFAPETKAYGVGHEAYVGYPGSLGLTDIKEAAEFRSVLYCDGKQLIRLPFSQRRKVRIISFRGDNVANFDVMEQIEWAKQQTHKPLIKVNWDTDSEAYTSKLTSLHEHALVKLQQMPVGASEIEVEGEELSCRADVSSDLKIDRALHVCCEEDEELYSLASNVLKGDIKDTLDTFKKGFDL